VKDVDCPVKLTSEVIGGKWKPSILFYLEDGTRRFSELQRLIPSSTKKMLTKHLRELERDGIIHRTIYPQVPPRVEYSLTRHGQSLRPILVLMSNWGKRHRARYGTANGNGNRNGTVVNQTARPKEAVHFGG
jgi:DNA-binding HxlR family transcriptional regulator